MIKQGIYPLFLNQVHRHPDAPALAFQGKTRSYGQLAQQVRHLAGQLQASGIKQGDVVMVQMPNSPALVVLLLAASALGVVLAPVSISLPPSAIATAAENVGAIGLINLNPQGIDGLAHWQLDFDTGSVVNAKAPDTLTLPDVSPDSTYVLILTSGSTGTPKPIILRQSTKLKRIFAGAVDLYGVPAGSAVLAGSPVSHSLGMRLVLLALLTGGTAVVLPQFSPAAWLEAVNTHQVRFTIAVSTHLLQLAEVLENSAMPASLQTLVSSSALLPPSVKGWWLEHFEGAFHECYGASEVGIVTNLDTETAKEAQGSVGKPLPYVDLKIVNDKGHPCAPGEVGEIICRSETVCAGYWQRPDLEAQAFRDGYFHTGDLGYLDEKGLLYLAGRKSEMIIVGGINVYPPDIEDVIQRVQGVREVAVIGMPDERLGEKVVACLAVDASFNQKQMMQQCLTHLADYQLPRRFEFFEALPKNDIGKLNKKALKEQLMGEECDGKDKTK